MVNFLLKLAASAIFIFLLARQVDVDNVLNHLLGVDAIAIMAAIALLGSLTLVQAFRWRTIIRVLGGDLGLRAVWLIAMVGLFFNQTLPSTVGGDGMRMWRAYKAGLAFGPAASGVILDRLAGLGGLLIISALGVPALFALAGDSPVLWMIPAIIVAGIAGFAVVMTIDRLPPGLRRWRAVRWMAQLASDARRVLLSPGTSAVVLAWSVLVHSITALVVMIIARGLGIDVGIVDCLVLMPPVILVATLPISVAGWGVREGAMVVAFAFAGVGKDEAVALSVLFGLAVMVVGLPGGLIWFLTGRERARPPSLESASDTDLAKIKD